MKRTLVLGVVLGALLGVTSLSWALDVKWGGDFRLRGFYIDNLTDFDENTQDSAAYYSSRFLLTTTVSEDKVSGVVTLVAGRSLTNGHANRLLGDATVPPYGPDAGSDVGILEAYIKAGLGMVDLKAGRAVYKLGNGIILDDAMDGIWLDFGAGPAKLTAAAIKLAEVTDGTVVAIGDPTAAGSGTGGDSDLYVLNVGLPDHNVNAFLGYLMDRDGTMLGAKASLITLGAAADMDLGAMAIRGELDFLTGSYDGGADLGGLNLVIGGKLKGAVPIGVDLIYTSGQDTGTEVNINGLNGNYPLGIILTNSGARSLDTKDGTCLSSFGAPLPGGGSASCIGGAGLTAVKVSGGFNFGAQTLDLAAIWAQATEDATVLDSDLGIELDATLTVALGKRLTYLAGVGYFMPGDAFGPSPDSPVVLVNQLNYTF